MFNIQIKVQWQKKILLGVMTYNFIKDLITKIMTWVGRLPGTLTNSQSFSLSLPLFLSPTPYLSPSFCPFSFAVTAGRLRQFCNRIANFDKLLSTSISALILRYLGCKVFYVLLKKQWRTGSGGAHL